MPPIIGHAIFGERNRGHDLLGASPAAVGARRLAAKMDLRGSPPPYAEWTPYLSGFADGEHYVLSRTAQDPDAPRHMVFSRAFLIPLELASQQENITGLLALLESLGRSKDEPTDLVWPEGTTPSAHLGLSQALLKDSDGPVVWPGQDGFGDAIAGIWRNLWPAARAQLSFRLAFSPQDVLSDPPDIACTPAKLLGRWSGYRIARDGDDPENRLALDILMGAHGAGSIRPLVGSLAAGGASLRSTAVLAEVAVAASSGTELTDLIDAMRMAASLAADPKVGADVKQALVTRAATAFMAAGCQEARMARNLDLAAFADPAPFWSGLSSWAADGIWKERDGSMTALTIADAVSSATNAPVASWRKAVADGLKAAWSDPGSEVVSATWRALAERPGLLADLMSVSRPAKLDVTLSSRPPVRLEMDRAELLLTSAVRAKMPQLHASVCAIAFTPDDAMDRHLADGEYNVESLRLSASKATPQQILSAALRHDNETLTGMGAKEAAAQPALLKSLDPGDPRWLSLWSLVLQANQEAWQGPAHPRRVMDRLLTELSQGGDAHGLIDLLATTPLADVLWFPRRAELWRHLPGTARADYLAATADAWVAAVGNGDDSGMLEEELAAAVATPGRIEPLLEHALSRPEIGCTAFRALPRLREGEFRNWFGRLVDRGGQVDRESANGLGRLVASRGWRSAAVDIADAVHDRSRDDLRPALSYIKDLLGFLTRWRLNILGESPGVSDKWRILEEVAFELYGYGPGADSLWTRAGGKEADIPKADTGREAWRIVISAAERGRGAIDVDRLIEVMSWDNPHNWALNRMKSDPMFRTKK
nr:effector-associated domain EAD1-containing protein [Aureimonas phyllosphaerae]